MEGSMEPTMKYLRQKSYLEAARAQLRFLRIRVGFQPNQYPGSLPGPLVKLEDLRHLPPSASLGQAQLEGHHANLDQEWRKQARLQRAGRTGVTSASSRYFVLFALPTRQGGAACSE